METRVTDAAAIGVPAQVPPAPPPSRRVRQARGPLNPKTLNPRP